MDQLITALPGYGFSGIVCAILLYAYFDKDKKLRESEAARIDDAHRVTSLVLNLTSRIQDTIDRLERLCDVVSADRERRK